MIKSQNWKYSKIDELNESYSSYMGELPNFIYTFRHIETTECRILEIIIISITFDIIRPS